MSGIMKDAYRLGFHAAFELHMGMTATELDAGFNALMDPATLRESPPSGFFESIDVADVLADWKTVPVNLV